MANAVPKKHRVFLFRLQTLIIDGGHLVLRHILDHKFHVQSISFNVCLSQEKPTLIRLKSRNTITQSQFDLLYPASSQPPSTSDLDITLIICLLRNLKTCGLNKKFDWSIPPSQGDTCLEADIYRLKHYRNEIAHIATTTGINLMDFRFKWTKIEQILQRLDLSNPVPDLQKIIDDMKTSPLDPEAEEIIKKTTKEWKAMEKSLKVDLKLVKTDLQVLNEEVKKKTMEYSKLIKDTQKRISGLESQISKGVVEDAKNEYLKKRKNLKEDLITLYRCQYHTLPLSPLIEEHDTPLLDFYVMPDINVVESQRSFEGGSEIKSKVTSLHDVFYQKSKLCREIFLIADAGLGKTAFSKRLALTWCQAHKRTEDDSKCFEKEEMESMSEFEFLFLISLRDCSEECDIDQMIRKQIVRLLAHKSDIIETVLTEEKCLVILDGLDEWTHSTSSCAYGQSEIPHRKARECTTILTTARKWKLSVIKLKSSQIDKKLELDGLSKMSSGKLKKSVMRLFSQKAEKMIDDQIKDFNTIVAEKDVSVLESIPLLLMYLLCLWRDKIDLGRSKCIIYCQMVELLLKRTFEKYPNMRNTCARPIISIPKCFDTQVNCKENYAFLSSLGRLAFNAMFSKTREKRLVFDRSLVDQDLVTAFLDLGLRSGLITQNKESKLTSEKQKTSFSHKTVQEFFAALYISTCSDQKVLEKVISFCNSVKDILEMSQVFIFISGINPELISSVSEKFTKVINEDKMTHVYRSETVPLSDINEKALKEIQDMYISCFKEFPENTAYNLFLQYFIIDKDCQQNTYYTNLQRLAVQKKINIKSISIEREGIRSLPEIITECNLSDSALNCQKIFYRGECKVVELVPLLSSTVKCVTILSHEWQNNHFIRKVSFWSRELSTILQENNQLQAIYIACFNFNHDVLKAFLNYLICRKSMKEIKLFNLSCTDHGNSCSGFNFDLSQHTELRCLGLRDIPLSQLNVNVSLLEDCRVGKFSNPGIVKSYLSNISEASKLQIFTCHSLQSSDDIQTMLQTLSLLVTLKHVTLLHMNLGESLLPHEIVNIEYVRLCKVTMSSLTLRNLVSWLENLPQQITVDMVDCEITTAIEFEKIKKDIQTSDKFVVLRDGKRLDGMYGFKFTSIK